MVKAYLTAPPPGPAATNYFVTPSVTLASPATTLVRIYDHTGRPLNIDMNGAGTEFTPISTYYLAGDAPGPTATNEDVCPSHIIL